MYSRIDQRRRTTQNVSNKINSTNGTLTRGTHFFMRRKMNETNNVPKFDNKYHNQINRNKINNDVYSSETSSSTNSTNISSEDNSDDVLQNNINPLFKAQMENIQRMKNVNKPKSNTDNNNNNNELNMSFEQLKSDKQFMKNIEQISEVFTKINGSTHSSVELIYNFKHMTNNILSYFSTISNQKEHIEDVLLKLVKHLSVIIKKKGSNDSNSKLSDMMTNNINADTHSGTNSESASNNSITIQDFLANNNQAINTDTYSVTNSDSTSNNSITIEEILATNSMSEKSNSINKTHDTKLNSSSDNISISSDYSNESDKISISKPRIFGY